MCATLDTTLVRWSFGKIHQDNCQTQVSTMTCVHMQRHPFCLWCPPAVPQSCPSLNLLNRNHPISFGTDHEWEIMCRWLLWLPHICNAWTHLGATTVEHQQQNPAADAATALQNRAI